MLLRKEGKVDILIRKHAEEVKAGIEALKEAVIAYIDGDEEKFKRAAELTDSKESDADRARREAENALYAGGYLPVYREDFSIFMDLVDNMSDNAEAVTHFLALENPSIPPQWGKDIKEIAEKTLEAFLAFHRCFLFIYEDMEKAYSSTEQVRNLEKEIDGIQHGILQELFQSDLGLAEKIHLKEFVLKLGQISDAAENASDKVRGLTLKTGF